MDLEKLQTKLLAAARSKPPSDAVPYAFEQRVLARLVAGAPEDPWCLWGRALWRAAAASVGLAVLLTAWSFWPGHPVASATLEDTVFAEAEQINETW